VGRVDHPGVGCAQLGVVAMFFFSGLTLYRRHPLRGWFAAATLTFMASLTLRTADVHVCDHHHIGTHYWWHLLNGTVIALLLQALIRHRTAEALEPVTARR